MLNWGHGHVARSIGLIRQLIENQNELIIAGDPDQQKIFRQYFPDLTYVQHEGYPFKFGGKGSFSWDLAKTIPQLKNRLNQERIEVENYCRDLNPDIVISDHRYGFHSEKVTSVFVTHQLQLPVRRYEKGVQRWHRKLINSFDHVWVMDYSDNRLAGKLSEPKGFSNVSYIGPYSRFRNLGHVEKKGEVLIASGPDIYAQQLIDEVYKPGMAVICSGHLKVPESAVRLSDNWIEQDKVISSAAHIISRSGYSTIMDQEFLSVASDLIPTPGQSEQIYLAELRNK